MAELTCGSVFSGVGLLDLGLHLAGIRHLWFAEKDEYRRSVLAARWPEAVIYDDVRAVDARAARVDIVAGGPPCKGVSSLPLPVAVKRLLPTPTKEDSRNSRRATARTEEWTSNTGTTLLDAALLSSGESTAPLSAGGKSSSAGLRLSPSFVEWMMGLPLCGVCGLGWSAPDCQHSATAFSFRPDGCAEPASSSTPRGATNEE